MCSIESIPVFCITLERRTDRWKRFQEQPGYSDLAIRRFMGVDGKKIDIIRDTRVEMSTKRNILFKTRRSHEELDSVGGVGCALSHIALWTWLVENGHEYMVVFEDDAKLTKDFVTAFSSVVKKSQWDIFLLGSSRHEATQTEDPDVIDIKEFHGLYAYIITKQCAERLLQCVYPIHCHIDLWICIFKQLHGLKILGSTKTNMITNGSRTEIQTSDYCHICNIPSDYTRNYVFMSKPSYYAAMLCELLVIGGVLYMGYMIYKGNSSKLKQ